MKILILGGSGQIGTMLARAFVAEEHEVVVISRQPATKPWRVVAWDALSAECEGADIVINLAGRSVNCRYNAANRSEIVDSRVQTTNAVGEAIARAKRPPSTRTDTMPQTMKTASSAVKSRTCRRLGVSASA